MSRVSENSATSALNFTLNRAKEKLEDLQLKGSTLKSMRRPSDNPVANVEALSIGSTQNDQKQYLRNADYAMMQLQTTENTLEQITDGLNKAKEIAIAQASNLHNPDVKKNVANEILQIRNSIMGLANKKLGHRYIFGGMNTLERPFDNDGTYKGDKRHITLEVTKDFYVPINLNGEEVFYSSDTSRDQRTHPLEKFPEMKGSPESPENEIIKKTKSGRQIASEEKLIEKEGDSFKNRSNVFGILDNLIASLENSDTKLTQAILEPFDDAISRIITMRTRIGSIIGTVETNKASIDHDNIELASRKSQLVDADAAELFSDIQKQQQILQTTYKSSKHLLNQSLLDYLR